MDDNDQNDDSSPEDDMAENLRQEWRLIVGGKPVKVKRDNLEHSTRLDKRRRALFRLL